MSLRSQIESYLLEITARARSAQDRCNTLLAYDFISKAPRNLAITISRICGFLAQAAAAIFAQIEWDDPDTIEPDILRLRSADFLIQQLAAHLRYVQGARTDRLPWGIIPSFEKLASTLVPGRQILLRPKWNYNYTVTLSDFRRSYIKGIEEFRDDLPGVNIETDVLHDLQEPLHIVAFPSLERENILLHTLLGHELGHLFADRFLAKDRKKLFEQSIINEIGIITEQELRREGFTESKPGTLFYEETRNKRIAYNTDLASEYWSRALEELLSDVFGAILFGPAALFSTLEMAIQQSYDDSPMPETNFYPPWRMRLREVLDVIESGDSPFFPVKSDLFESKDAANRAERVNAKYIMVRDLCQKRSDIEAITAPIAQLAYAKVEASVREGTAFFLGECGLGKRGRRAVPSSVFKNMAALIARLDYDIPPNAIEQTIHDHTKVGLVEIINAAWFHRVSLASPVLLENREVNEGLMGQRRKANRLTLKAIEFSELAADYWKKSSKGAIPRGKNVRRGRVSGEGVIDNASREESQQPTSVLSASDIVACMEREELLQRLIVTPLLDPEESIGAGAVDIRLGNQFIIMKREAFPLLDVGKSQTVDIDIERYQEKIIRPYREPFILHPRQLVIGSTLEYVQIPSDLMCYVIGKSTWGRMGLIIATATKVDPGFKGCITLEIINEGEIPLILYPGLPIAQLVLHKTSGKDTYEGSYSCAIGPEFPKFSGKAESWRYWMNSNKS